jgi:hypothetical protein
MGNIFGGKPKTPKIQEVTPLEKVYQSDEEKQKIYKNMAKRRKATVLSQLTQANIKTQKLGAAM